MFLATSRACFEILASSAGPPAFVDSDSTPVMQTPENSFSPHYSDFNADSVGEEKIGQSTVSNEPVKDKERKDTNAPIPVVEVMPVSGFLTKRPQMMIGMNGLENSDTKEREKLPSHVESKPPPDARDQPRPQPQGQLKSLQAGLRMPTIAPPPSCWDSYTREQRLIPMVQSPNLLQQGIIPGSFRTPVESRSRPQNSPPTAGETQGWDDRFTPKDRNYSIINREFHDRVVDPVTGKVFEFNTGTNKRRWL